MKRAAALWLALLLPAAGVADPPVKTTARDAALADKLAAGQAAAAAAIRGLEEQTAQYGSQLADLQAAQAQSSQRLVAAEADLAKLLPVMQRLSTAPASTLLAAPLPPGDAVRGLALLRGVAQTIAAQAHMVQIENAQLTALITAGQESQKRLVLAAAAQAQAEAAVARQIAAARAAEMAAADTQAAAITARLQAANRLDTINDAVKNLVPRAASPARITAGAGGAPVAGSIVQRFGAETLAGPATGISYAAAPGALVTAPCAGTVMFAAPFPSYGLMVIADCGHGDSVVLAGMQQLDVAQGQHLVHGQPLGTMLRFNPAKPAYQPRLYVELRQNGRPVDPTPWLIGGHSG
ncbi:murein hydrolase activator EnvC [Acidocella sp.]|uniref:murein hydrolase activator EnvC family protein n=1 Tax=Acidocella sp. TaxID=50710 RepID=UPI0026029FEA|nr:peptidoglycan DD-metalloendopeptidase family protein [Acidocella sp.]